MFVYTIQPVVSCIQTFNRGFDNRFDNRLYRVYSWLSNWLYNPVWQPVERTAVPSTRLSNWFDSRLSNRFDNWLYRVNGVLQTASQCVFCVPTTLPQWLPVPIRFRCLILLIDSWLVMLLNLTTATSCKKWAGVWKIMALPPSLTVKFGLGHYRLFFAACWPLWSVECFCWSSDQPMAFHHFAGRLWPRVKPVYGFHHTVAGVALNLTACLPVAWVQAVQCLVTSDLGSQSPERHCGKTAQPNRTHWMEKYVNSLDCCNVVRNGLRLLEFYLLTGWPLAWKNPEKWRNCKVIREKSGKTGNVGESIISFCRRARVNTLNHVMEF